MFGACRPRLPRKPPPLETLLAKAGTLGEAMPVLVHLASATHGARYLHWDELLRRRPPQDLSQDQWWLATKLARRAAGLSLPLLGVDRHPVLFCQPLLLLKILHQTDDGSRGMAGGTTGGCPS